MAYSDTSDEDVDLNNPNLDAALHQAEQLLGIPPEQARCADPTCLCGCQPFAARGSEKVSPRRQQDYAYGDTNESEQV